MIPSRIPRIVVSVLFVALLIARLAMKRMAARRATENARIDTQTSVARHGFSLQEVSRAAGINFVHQAPVLDPKLGPIMPEVASMGASVSIVDFDRDGWSDIYVANRAIGSEDAPD